MANNIEWGHASYLPTAVEHDDISGDYEGVKVGEVGVWLGSDGAMVLYGSREELVAWAEALIALAPTLPAREAEPITMTREQLAYLRAENEAERLSWGEVAEVQGEFEKIDPATLPEPAENAGISDMLDEIESRLPDPGLEDDLRLIRKYDPDEQWPAPGVAGVGP